MSKSRAVRTRVCGAMATLALLLPGQASAEVSGTSFVCTVEGSVTASMNWIGGGGTFSFGPTGLGQDCVVALRRAGAKTPESAVVSLVSLAQGSAGSFNSIFCMTGTMASGGGGGVKRTAGVIDDPAAVQAMQDANLNYHITYVDGQGTLTWGNASPGNPNPRITPTSTGPVGGGYVSISPWRGPGDPLGSQGGTFPGSPPDGQCTNGFNLEGTVTGVMAAPDPES